MGNICCNNFEESIYLSNISELKTKFIEEYKLYLLFLNQLKSDLNSSRSDKENNLIDVNENKNSNNINNKKFYIIPRKWFVNWEKRIEVIYKTNKYKSFDYDFNIPKDEKLQKFYYEIISDDLWLKLYRNQIYKLNSVTSNFKNGIICNNLIIFQYTGDNSNIIEIFFFEKDEDLFFTNLLFSFEKCKNAQSECYNLLKLLKKSPIQEILGNIKYDKSEEFNVKNNKMRIYNKTGQIEESIKTFRENQYDIQFINPIHGPHSFDNNENPNIYDERKIGDYFEANKYKDNYYGGLINLKIKTGEKTVNLHDIRGLDPNIYSKNLINNALNRNSSKTMRILKNNKHNSRNDNDKTKTFILSLKNSSLISNKISEIDYKNNSGNTNRKEDISAIFDNKLKNGNIFDYSEDNPNNQNFFESILYCLFNIKELTNFLLNNKEINNSLNNSFYNEYLKIIDFLYKNDSKIIDNLKINKDNDNIFDKDEEITKNKLIHSSPDYNYKKILKLVINQSSINIISKIINTLHLELNKRKERYVIKTESSIGIVNQNEEEEDKNKKYEKFINDCKENNDSKIYDILYGIKEIQIICNKCNKIHYKYEIMNLIELSIEELILYIKENNKNQIHYNLNIIDCLNFYSKEKKEKSNTVIFCSYCKEYQNYDYINNIYKYPKIFVLCFKYNTSELLYDLEINFDEIIQLDDEYKLIGIISLQKNKILNIDEDKFITYCKSDKKWICYNETRNNCDFNSEKKTIKPIVLFYQRMKE